MTHSKGEIGARLKRLRLDQSMTMDELAEKVGYTSKSKNTIIYQIEAGNNELQLSRLLMFTDVLKTNIYYLLGLTDVRDISDEDILRIIRDQYGEINETSEDTDLPESD